MAGLVPAICISVTPQRQCRFTEHCLETDLFHALSDVEHDMQRLPLSLTFLLISTLAYAQEQSVAPNPMSPSSSGTEGDGWLLTVIGIAVVVVAIGVYLFIKKARARI
jgi:hypothetical protein